MKRPASSNLALFVFLTLFAVVIPAREQSICHGTTAAGTLENGWKLPTGGSNFESYSSVGRLLGRTYVHSAVYSVVLDAYETMESSLPNTVFVYGETGSKDGGPFAPHKTHQNGLSVDFMVPVRDSRDRSVPLPTSMLNKWGYDLEFDATGRLDNLVIDYDAISEHLYQLHVSAESNGIKIWRVIFDPELQPSLYQTHRWSYLKKNIEFSTKRSWVRHDEHYHVDFLVDCQPAS